MKLVYKHISIILVVLVTIGICWQSFTVLHFYANQEQIEEDFCINKDKPELNCHGQCHLKNQLTIDPVDKSASLQVNALLIFQTFEEPAIVSIYEVPKTENGLQNYLFIIKEGTSLCLLDPPEIS